MSRTIWRAALCLAAICCSGLPGCQDPDLSIPIDSMTVYSLDGKEGGLRNEKPPAGEMFHKFPVLGKVDIASPKDRIAILAAIKKGIAKGDEGAKCFFPRHGVKFTQAGKKMEYADLALSAESSTCTPMAEVAPIHPKHGRHRTSDPRPASNGCRNLFAEAQLITRPHRACDRGHTTVRTSTLARAQATRECCYHQGTNAPRMPKLCGLVP